VHKTILEKRLERYKALGSKKRSILCQMISILYANATCLYSSLNPNGRGLLALNMSGFRIRHSKQILSLQKLFFFLVVCVLNLSL